ncbi:MAG: UDP-N-acetylmuramoylalanine--D-glutamate ligase, partial [Halothiobacillaceae bacterium]
MQHAVGLDKQQKCKTLVVGLGKTGLSCARFLVEQGSPVAVTDSREHPPGLAELRETLPNVAVFLGGFDELAFSSAEQIVVSPGVSIKEPLIAAAAARGIPVIGDIELFVQHAKAPIVAITGSNGKSTVTTLVGELLQCAGYKVAVGGNLGTPALTLLADDCDVYVMELSSFQLETTFSMNAAAAVVLNISPDHLDRYESMAAYAAAKMTVYRGDGVVVINRDEPLTAHWLTASRQWRSFGLSQPQQPEEFGIGEYAGQTWLMRGTTPLLPEEALTLRGRHNVANVLAALALLDALGVVAERVLERVKSFQPLQHRMQRVAEQGGVCWYNDSKGTNVGATTAALAGVPGSVVLIAGGIGKGADFTPLRQVVAAKARAVVLIGQDAKLLAEVLAGTAPLVYATTMGEAV